MSGHLVRRVSFVGSTAQEGPAADFSFLDYLSGQTETWRENCIALDFHDNIIDDLVNGFAVRNETPENRRQ